jgi:anti-sigma factor RsiW
MTCREAITLLPLFFDGELDAHQMRAVALHSARCASCEVELRHMERAQTLVSESVVAAVDDVDFAAFWRGIDDRLGAVRVSWWTRLLDRAGSGDRRWLIQVPAYAAAAAIAAFALLMLTRAPQPSTQPDATQIASTDNAAVIDSLETNVEAVTVLNDPETRTTVLWVSDDSVGEGSVP